MHAQFKITDQHNVHVFGWLEEGRVPGENPHMYRESTQTPHREVARDAQILFVCVHCFYKLLL